MGIANGVQNNVQKPARLCCINMVFFAQNIVKLSKFIFPRSNGSKKWEDCFIDKPDVISITQFDSVINQIKQQLRIDHLTTCHTETNVFEHDSAHAYAWKLKKGNLNIFYSLEHFSFPNTNSVLFFFWGCVCVCRRGRTFCISFTCRKGYVTKKLYKTRIAIMENSSIYMYVYFLFQSRCRCV